MFITKQKRSTLLILLLLAVLPLVQSCTKKEATPSEIKNNTQKINGIADCAFRLSNDYLVFDSHKDLDKYYQFLQTHQTQEINQFEVNNQFTSYSRKVENILKDYEILCESDNVTLDQIHNFQSENQKYVTITDEDFFLKIDGISNRIVNPDGYVQVGNRFFKHVGMTIYCTSIENKELLLNDNYTSNLVSQITVKKHSQGVASPGKTNQLNMWQSINNTTSSLCKQWHRTVMSMEFYTAGPGYDTWNTAELYVSFRYQIKNHKRNSLLIWYPDSRWSNNTGNYHSSINPYTNYNDNDNTAFVDRLYNYHAFTNGFIPQSVLNAWANGIYASMWAYVAGVSTFDVCGQKTVTY